MMMKGEEIRCTTLPERSSGKRILLQTHFSEKKNIQSANVLYANANCPSSATITPWTN